MYVCMCIHASSHPPLLNTSLNLRLPSHSTIHQSWEGLTPMYRQRMGLPVPDISIVGTQHSTVEKDANGQLL